MQFSLSSIAQALSLFMLTSGFTIALADSSIHWVNDRDYKVAISDKNKQPILSISLSYQGKTPYANETIKHNWRVVDTDFYRETFNNLTDTTINILGIKYSLDRGQLHTPRIKGDAEIKNLYGTTEIKPNASLQRNNAWVWAKKDNKLHRVFIFDYNHETFEVDIPLVYQR